MAYPTSWPVVQIHHKEKYIWLPAPPGLQQPKDFSCFHLPSSFPSEGRMKGLFASLHSPEKLRATTELLLNRHSARKSVPVSSCLFSGLAVMDYVQPQVGHKPAVYLSFPNILLQFLYHRGANALFQDAYCIKSTYFSEYFTVTQRDWTGFFFKCCCSFLGTFLIIKVSLFPEAWSWNDKLHHSFSLHRGPQADPAVTLEACAPHIPTLLPGHCVWNSSTSGLPAPAVFPSRTRGGKNEKYSQHFPPGPSHKH